MKKYFEHRCRTIERCMSEGPFRDQVTQLHNEMLEQIPCQCLDYCEKADPYSTTPDGYCRESAPQH